jgi:tetratricopeptide (TPR) repeat protein
MRTTGDSLKKQAGVIVWIVIILLVVPDFIAGMAPPDVDEKKLNQFKLARKLFDTGKQQFLTGKFKKAEKTFGKCLRAFPDFAPAGYYLTQIHYKKGDYERALKNIEAAKNSFRLLAEFMETTKHLYNKNLRDKERGIETHIYNLESATLVGNCYSNKITNQEIESLATARGDIQAKRMTSKPVLKDIPAGYFYAHGNILFKLKRYAGARDQYLTAIKIEPRHRKAYNNLINLYYSARKYQRARYYLEQAGAHGVNIDSRLQEAVYARTGN